MIVCGGYIQARAFEDAAIKVELVHPTTLLDEGFQNDWLYELAPTWKRKPGPKPAAPTRSQQEEVARQAAERIKIDEPPGKAPQARPDAENLGYGRPKPGGRRDRVMSYVDTFAFLTRIACTCHSFATRIAGFMKSRHGPQCRDPQLLFSSVCEKKSASLATVAAARARARHGMR